MQKLEREEYVEQAYFFRMFRDRLAENLSAQEILTQISEQLLSSTRLPFAVDFLATELKHSGLLANGFDKLAHYFGRFQAFVVQQAEDEKKGFTIQEALLILEREANYKAGTITPEGLFVYQFECIARNRLGYTRGLEAMAEDPFYTEDWRQFIGLMRKQAGTIDFSELIYLRSHWYVTEEKRKKPGYVPSMPPLFAEKEGRIAKASRGRDPLFLFAALQRQLGYPQVPKPQRRDDLGSLIQSFQVKIRELETRVKLLESEQRGTFDPSKFDLDSFRKIRDDD